MRPRVFPAEDVGDHDYRSRADRGFNEAAGIPRGRRRMWWQEPCQLSRFNEAAGIPRGRRPGVPPHVAARLASMRPRVFPAEDAIHVVVRPLPPAEASMRPRVFPAEDLPDRDESANRHQWGFNEAAGIPRGRRMMAAHALRRRFGLQ